MVDICIRFDWRRLGNVIATGAGLAFPPAPAVPGVWRITAGPVSYHGSARNLHTAMHLLAASDHAGDQWARRAVMTSIGARQTVVVDVITAAEAGPPGRLAPLDLASDNTRALVTTAAITAGNLHGPASGPVGLGRPGPPSDEQHQSRSTTARGRRKWLVAALTTLTTLGILGAVGTYYVPGILDKLGERVTDRAAIDFDVITDRTLTANYVFNGSTQPADVPTEALDGGHHEEFHRWAIRHGGVLADEQTVRIVLRGRTADLVHVDDIRVKVVNRTSPRTGWYNAWEGCGGAVEPRVVFVDADAEDEPPRWYVGGVEVVRPAFTVSVADDEVIDINISSTRDEIEWVVEVAYSSADRDDVLRIDDHGKPFRLTTITNAQAYESTADGLVRNPYRDGANSDEGSRPPC